MLLSDKSTLPPFHSIVSKYYDSYDTGNSKNQFMHNECSNVLNQLSSLSEVVLQSELDVFCKFGGSDYGKFIRKTFPTFSNDYPVLDDFLSGMVKNHHQTSTIIASRLHKDWKNIVVTLGLDTKTNPDNKIDLNLNLGDNHNGAGVGLLCFSNGTKIVYKSRSSDVSSAYNYFISWVNSKLNTDLRTFKVLDCGDYSWLEFVNHEQIDTQSDLAEYYYKAGILLACTLLLGSKDCHQENVIAAGKNPVIIDHETIIQPHFNNSNGYSWESFNNIPSFSVLESSLIINANTGTPLNCVGYGINNYLEFTNLEAQIVKPNTIDSKRVPRFVSRKIVDKNIPINGGRYVFVNQFLDNFVNGFTTAYDMFLTSKAELLSDSSPIELFKDKMVRYVWRPTFVYCKILKYLRSPVFMSSFDVYRSKLDELLSKAYKCEDMKAYGFILEYEIDQMLKNDIPIFYLTSQDYFLGGNKKNRIFQYNCLENIYHRINLLSADHKKEQLNYITSWVNIDQKFN